MAGILIFCRVSVEARERLPFLLHQLGKTGAGQLQNIRFPLLIL